MGFRFTESEGLSSGASETVRMLVEPGSIGGNQIASSWSYSIKEGLENRNKELGPSV